MASIQDHDQSTILQAQPEFSFKSKNGKNYQRKKIYDKEMLGLLDP